MAMLESGEMYLETILILSNDKPNVRSIDIAEYMKFSKPSVSRAIGILKDDGFVLVGDNGQITLTEKGKEHATKIYERHTILSQLLKSIGVPDDIADEDACRIEHYISDTTFEAIKRSMQKK